MRTFSIKTFGCKVNQYESQFIRERLLANGYNENSNSDSPSLCIVNTCCVTDRAEKKGRQYINHLRRFYPDSLLLITGCSVDYKPESFGKVDFLVPNEKKFSIAEILDGHQGVGGISNFQGHTRAFVKVQDGCNQFCSYCILPYVRGRSRSRSLQDVLDEVKRLASNGYREVVLTGIHLGDYNELVRLLELSGELPDLLRLRLSSLEPQDIIDSILEVVSRNPKICRHFHIPLQSGSDRVLSRMNRRYTYLEYKRLIKNIKEKIPEVIFTTDLLVGFPGETEEDFLATCNVICEIGFIKVHIFPYSHRPGTAAANFLDRVPQGEIRRRVAILKDIADKTAYEMKKNMVGSLQDVLIESSETKFTPSRRYVGAGFSGYTSGYTPVRIPRAVIKNELVRVKIIGLDNQYLVGEVST